MGDTKKGDKKAMGRQREREREPGGESEKDNSTTIVNFYVLQTHMVCTIFQGIVCFSKMTAVC